MRIAWYNVHGQLETATQTENAQWQAGGYWFHDVRPFQYGEYRLTFECTDDSIEPLVHSIRVDPPGKHEQQLLVLERSGIHAA
jgi:hypothetical protein